MTKALEAAARVYCKHLNGIGWNGVDDMQKMRCMTEAAEIIRAFAESVTDEMANEAVDLMPCQQTLYPDRELERWACKAIRAAILKGIEE